MENIKTTRHTTTDGEPRDTINVDHCNSHIQTKPEEDATHKNTEEAYTPEESYFDIEVENDEKIREINEDSGKFE